MQVVILCGGLGTRLKTITKSIPKSLVPINGKPFLEHQLVLLRDQGFKDFVFLIGHLGEQIKDYFGDGNSWGVSIQYSQEIKPLGTGGAIKNAEPYLKDVFLLLYGDSYLKMDYASLWNDFKKQKCLAELVIFDDKKKQTNVIPNISWEEQTRKITAYEKDSNHVHCYMDAGVMVLSKKIFSLFPEGSFSLEKEVFPRLISEKNLVGYEVSKRFYDIGTFERLLTFKRQKA